MRLVKQGRTIGSQPPEPIRIPPVRDEDEDEYDDEQDHKRCPDCRGTGFYVGFLERSYCTTCDGSGFL